MAGVLVNNILTRAFWGDEAWTTLISSLPLWDLVKTTAADFHPPLYYTVIHFWMLFFGNSEVSIRVVSLIFWILSGMVVYFLARKLNLSKRLAAFSSLLVLFNPFISVYAFEARNYTLFVFISLASFLGFYELLLASRLNLLKAAGYIFITTAGLYTHYYMFFIVLAQSLFILFFRRDLFKKFLIFNFVFLILYLPWLPFFFSQVKSVAGGYWISPLTVEAIRDTAKVLVRGEQIFSLYQFLPTMYLVILVMSALIGYKNRRLITLPTALFLLWFLVPFVTPIAISLIRPLFFYRYLIIVVVPVMLLPVYLAGSGQKDNTGRIAKKFFLTFLIGLMAIYFYSDGLAFSSRTNQLFRVVVGRVHRESRPGDVIYTVLPSFAEVVYYNNYDGAPMPVKVLTSGLSAASGKALLDTYVAKGYVTLEDLPKKGRYWFLEPGPNYQLVTK